MHLSRLVVLAIVLCLIAGTKCSEIFVSAEEGDDVLNDGLSSSNPVASLSRAFALLSGPHATVTTLGGELRGSLNTNLLLGQSNSSIPIIQGFEHVNSLDGYVSLEIRSYNQSDPTTIYLEDEAQAWLMIVSSTAISIDSFRVYAEGGNISLATAVTTDSKGNDVSLAPTASLRLENSSHVSLTSIHFESIWPVYQRAIELHHTNASFVDLVVHNRSTIARVDWVTLTIDDADGASSGAAILSMDSPISLDASAFHNNAAWTGGAIFLGASAGIPVSLSVSRCSFEGNFAEYDGGTIYITSSSKASLSDSLFVNNRAARGFAGSGAGVYCTDTDMLMITSCTFSSNSARYGAAVTSFWTRLFLLKDSLFNENTARIAGGAFHAGGQVANNLVSVQNCSFFSNYASIQGGSLSVALAEEIMVENSIFNNSEAGGSGGAMYLSGTSLENDTVTVADCVLNDGAASNWGGAIYANDYTFLTVQNCVLNHNIGEHKGGALYLNEIDSVLLDHCTFIGNRAESYDGGAIYSTSSGSLSDTVNILASSFYGNQAAQEGGGIYTESVILNIIETEFNDNIASDGGAIAILYTSAMLENCSLSSNSCSESEGSGGALYLVANQAHHNCTIINSSFSKNTAFQGAGISCFGIGTCIVSNSAFLGNNVSDSGGAIICQEGVSCQVIQTQVARNQANKGGGIYCESSSCYVSKSTFSFNHADVGFGIASWYVAPTIQSSLFENNTGTSGTIYVYQGSAVQVTDSQFIGNSALLEGAAVYVQEVTVALVSGSLFVANSIPLADAYYGGAVFCNSNAACTISNSSFHLNVGGFGGAVGSVDSLLTCVACTFEHNEAAYGGAVYNILSTSSTTTLEITSSVFRHNSALENGGALFSRFVPVLLDQVQLVGNSAKLGAAISVEQCDVDQSLIATNCSLVANIADRGGGIYAYLVQHVSLISCAFRNNEASNHGGALYKSSAGLSVNDCSFDSNKADVNGGGIYIEDSGLISQSTTVQDCSFSDNVAGLFGGAIYSLVVPSSVTDSEFHHNIATDGGAVHMNCATRLYITDFSNIIANNNKADRGGGLYLERCIVSLIDSLFTNNIVVDSGAGIYLTSIKTVANISYSTFSSNTAVSGGGISSFETSLRLVAVNLMDNIATNGAGVHTDFGPSSFLLDSFFSLLYVSGNQASSDGAGIWFSNGHLVLDHLLFDSNSVEGNGGALFVTSSEITIQNNTFSNNIANTDGGCIYLSKANLTLSNSSFISNTAISFGAAMYLSSSSISLASFQIRNNQAFGGSGIYLLDTSGRLAHGLIANNAHLDDSISASSSVSSSSSSLQHSVLASLSSSDRIEIDHVIIQNNIGGGIGLAESGSWYIHHSIIAGNSITVANNLGGAGLAIYPLSTLSESTSSSFPSPLAFVLEDCTVSDNILAVGNGAGIHLASLSNSSQNVILTGTIIVRNNTAISGNGGGLYAENWINVDSSYSSIQIHSNHAVLGGGIYLSTCPTQKIPSNVYLFSNQATQSGGGLYFGSAGCIQGGVTASDNSAGLFGNTLASAARYFQFINNTSPTTPDEWGASIELQTHFVDDFNNTVIDEDTLTNSLVYAYINDPAVDVSISGELYSVLSSEGRSIHQLSLQAPLSVPTTLVVQASTGSSVLGSLSVNITFLRCPLGQEEVDGVCSTCSRGSFRLSHSVSTCSECPTGSTCQGTVVLASLNYWRNPLILDTVLHEHQEDAYYLCSPGKCCPDGGSTEESTGLTGCSSSNACGSQMTGTLCGSCQDGYTSNGESCVKCTETDPSQVFLLLFIFSAFITFFLISKPASNSSISLLLFFVQSIPFIIRDPWSVVTSLRLFNFDFGSLASSDSCLYPGSPFALVIARLLCVFAMFALFGLFFAAASVLARPSCLSGIFQMIFCNRSRTAVFSAGFICLISYSYYELSAVSFELVGCREVQGVDVLIVAPNTECWTGNHTAWAVIAFTLLLFITLGLPLFLIYLFRTVDNLPILSDRDPAAPTRLKLLNNETVQVSPTLPPSPPPPPPPPSPLPPSPLPPSPLPPSPLPPLPPLHVSSSLESDQGSFRNGRRAMGVRPLNLNGHRRRHFVSSSTTTTTNTTNSNNNNNNHHHHHNNNRSSNNNNRIQLTPLTPAKKRVKRPLRLKREGKVSKSIQSKVSTVVHIDDARQDCNQRPEYAMHQEQQEQQQQRQEHQEPVEISPFASPGEIKTEQILSIRTGNKITVSEDHEAPQRQNQNVSVNQDDENQDQSLTSQVFFKSKYLINYDVYVRPDGQLGGSGSHVPWVLFGPWRHKEALLLFFYRKAAVVALSTFVLDYTLSRCLMCLLFVICLTLTLLLDTLYVHRDTILDATLLALLACISGLEIVIGIFGADTDDYYVYLVRVFQSLMMSLGVLAFVLSKSLAI